ncbi:alpha/beta hydrolase [Aquabacterium sp. A7-Y]|uniref:alpha/beta fold hydrolase n=1 Tax=Aquabacterium sp. A7-Y TaxID=1349605 RepID=UPI00223D6907|nr:alpha/beta hydrolase [Aquabacterium sp. A7-Y]MCW7541922.1 alpha/beta hydrolase [Aquabacterium sp. A7-Y]
MSLASLGTPAPVARQGSQPMAPAAAPLPHERRDAVLRRHAVSVRGSGPRTLLFAHGFGCDQTLWREVAPAFEADHRVVLFDHVGAGGSDSAAYGARHAALGGYAEDLLELCQALALERVCFVGHSVSTMMGLLAGITSPHVFERQIWIAPSPCFVDHPPDYHGGFALAEIAGLVELIERNELRWPEFLAPMVMQNAERPELADELHRSFCRMAPGVAREFARISFMSDHRALLPLLQQPTLVLQCSADPLAPPSVGEYLERKLPRGRQRRLDAAGHCPHVSHPREVIAAITAELALWRAEDA